MVVPYRVVVLVATGSGPLSDSSLALGTGLFLILIEWVLVSPLISALHVHAVAEAGAGRSPQLGDVARKGLRVLPVAAAASIIAALGIAVGLLLFIVPGVILMFRWYVVAQAAAIENEGWLPALRRSRQLAAGRYGHMFVFAVLVALIVSVPHSCRVCFRTPGHHRGILFDRPDRRGFHPFLRRPCDRVSLL